MKFKPWNWVLGTGVYIEDIEADAQKRLDAIILELQHTFSKVRLAKSGYMYIFNSDNTALILLKNTDHLFQTTLISIINQIIRQ